MTSCSLNMLCSLLFLCFSYSISCSSYFPHSVPCFLNFLFLFLLLVKFQLRQSPFELSPYNSPFQLLPGLSDMPLACVSLIMSYIPVSQPCTSVVAFKVYLFPDTCLYLNRGTFFSSFLIWHLAQRLAHNRHSDNICWISEKSMHLFHRITHYWLLFLQVQ